LTLGDSVTKSIRTEFSVHTAGGAEALRADRRVFFLYSVDFTPESSPRPNPLPSGAFGAFLIALFRGKLRAKQFWSVKAETTSTTALVYPLIFGTLIFALFAGVTSRNRRPNPLPGSAGRRPRW
jgi:hypothetical protein